MTPFEAPYNLRSNIRNKRMNRKQIQLDYGHLPVEQLPTDVKQFVVNDEELCSWFNDNHWLQGLLELKRAEQPAATVVDRIQHRVETRLANTRPDELAALAAATNTASATSGKRRWTTILFGNDGDTGRSSSVFAKFATPVTIAAGMVVGLYAVNLMYTDPGPGPIVSPDNPELGLTTMPTAVNNGELLLTNQHQNAIQPGLTPVKSSPSDGGLIRAVNQPD